MGQRQPLLLAAAHELANDLVRRPEGHALLRQSFRDVRRLRVIALHGAEGAVRVEADVLEPGSKE